MRKPTSRLDRAGWQRCRQRGAVSVMFGLTLVMLIGFAGLAIDLGRFFVIKSELQNAMDACALAAVTQLRPGQGDSTALTKARAYGKLAASRNRADFQSTAITLGDEHITFSDKIDFSTTATYDTARFVRCSYPLTGLPVYFMQVLSPDLSAQTISAQAVAGLGTASDTACAVPVGVCKGSGANYGLQVGEWLASKSGTSLGKGFFGWLDYNQKGGGKTDLVNTLTGAGQCNLADVASVTGSVISPGNKTSVDAAWNSRFGWYDKLTPAGAPPDYTGYAYSQDANWPAGAGAYLNYVNAKGAYLSYQGGVPAGIDGAPGVKNKYAALPLSAANTSSRRIALAPVIDCADLSKSVPIEAWACVLMLNPMISAGTPKSPEVWDTAKVEYLGLTTDEGSPCAQHLPLIGQ